MLERLKDLGPVRVVMAYGQSQGGAYAAALAFNSFLTMFPLILGVLTVVGIAIHDPVAQRKVETAIVSVFPSDSHAQLLTALKGVKHSAGLLGALSVLGLLWTATGYFASMEWALTRIFGSKQRDMVRQRLMGLVMMVVFVLAILVAVTANGAAAIIPFAPVGGAVVGLLVMLLLYLAIYRFVPNRTFSLGDILPGAALAAVLTEIFTLAFPIYARVAHGFNTYGTEFALFFLIATWLYFLAQILLFGAVFIRFRVGSPADEGLVASPQSESKAVPDPGEAVEAHQRAASAPPAAAPPRRLRRQRGLKAALFGALGALLALVLAAPGRRQLGLRKRARSF